MFRHLPLILKNSWRNRRRTSLTIVSIGVSLCLLGLLMAIYHAFYFSDPTPAQALRLITRNRISLANSLPESYRDRIKAIPGVNGTMIQGWFGGQYIDDRPEHMFARFAAEPDRLFSIYSEIQMPEDQKKAFHERTACIMDRKLADKYRLHLGDRITIKGDIYPFNLDLTLRGLFEPSVEHSDVLYFNREYLEQSMPERRRGSAGFIVTLVNSAADVPRVIKAIDEEFRNSTAQTKTDTESAFGLSFVSMLGNVKGFLLSICAAVTFTILLVSANTIAMSVRERVREVGILKTLGYTRSAILGIILGEAVAISLIGGLFGIVLAMGLARVVRSMPAFIQQLKTLSIAPPVALLCLCIAALIGLVSAFVPAYNASRISIVDALRSTD